jgi:uncharacterized glyoxalase superfamily protein PhnB
VTVEALPEGYHTVTPFLRAKRADQLVEFMQKAFGGKESGRMLGPDGSIMHTEIRIGDSAVMLSEAMGDFPPITGGFYLAVEDCDATYRRAVQAGARSEMEPHDEFWGDRTATVTDFAGNTWWIATHVEDVSEEETRRRMDALMSQSPPA